MKRHKETPSPVERKKLESMDKNNENIPFGINGEDDFTNENIEDNDRSTKCVSKPSGRLKVITGRQF